MYPLVLDASLNKVWDNTTFQDVANLIMDNWDALPSSSDLANTLSLNNARDAVTFRQLGALVKSQELSQSLPTDYMPRASSKFNDTKDIVNLARTVYSIIAHAKPKAKPPINLWTADTGLTNVAANSAAVLAVKPAPVVCPSGRVNALAIKCLAADTFVSARIAAAGIPANFTLGGAYSVGMWVYWPGTSGSVTLRFSTSNFGADRKEFPWAWSGQLHTGWNLVTVNPAGQAVNNPGGVAWTVAGAYTDATVVNGIEVLLNTPGTVDVEIYIDSIFYTTSKQVKGSVVLGFDAYGEASIVSLALPALQARKLKAYWAGDANLVDGTQNARNLAQQWYDGGMDLITQGYNHVDYTQNSGLLAQNYKDAQAVHKAAGWERGLGMFSYPLSSNDVVTDGILAAQGVKFARSGWAWQIHENEFNAGPKLLGHGAVNIGGKSLQNVKDIITGSEYLGTTVFLFCHGFVTGGTGGSPPADALKWYIEDYIALLDWLVAKRDAGTLYVEGAYEWYRRRKRMIG